MKNIWRCLTAVLFAIVAMSFVAEKQPLTIFLAGDSTMADKRVNAYPETGWGTRFRNFFDSSITIVNKAQNGRSTRTFIADGLWKSIYENIHPGDYVLIQFGHNDEVPTKASYTNESDFKHNLILFITQAREKQGNPILITPVARRSFDSTGAIKDTHTRYAQLIRETAATQHVPLIDLDKESMALLQSLGPERAKLLYNYLAPDENPNYPQGHIDDTHFNELGARKMAELVLADLRKISPELNSRVVTSNWGAK